MAIFIIKTTPQIGTVEITTSPDTKFVDWMIACEFFTNKTAQFSNAGYEKALELIAKGSMQYKGIKNEEMED